MLVLRWEMFMLLNIETPEREKARRCGLQVKMGRWQQVDGRIGLSEIPAWLPVSDVLLRNFRHVANDNDFL